MHIRVYTYTQRGGGGGGGNFGRNSTAAVSKVVEKGCCEASVFGCAAIIRLCRIHLYPRYNILPSVSPRRTCSFAR